MTTQPVVAPTQSLVPASPVAQPIRRLDLLLTVGDAPGLLTAPINGLAVDHQGNIYVAEATPGDKVHVFDAQGTLLATWGGGHGSGDGQFDLITSLAVDEQDNVYVADFNNVRIQKFDRSGKVLAQWPTEQPAGPTGLALDASGNVYVVNHRTHAHYVQKFDGPGRQLLAWGTTGRGPGEFQAGSSGGPEGVATDTAGHVYVCDPGNARVQVFADDGTFLSTFGSVGIGEGKFFDGPFQLGVDDTGNVYVTDGSSIQEFDASGQFLARWEQPGADQIAVDHQGNLYVTGDKKRSVLKYRKP